MNITKFAKFALPWGAFISFFFLNDSPEELGKVADWGERVIQIAASLPVATANMLFKDFQFHVYDMDSHLLDQKTAQRQANLQEYDFGQQGWQTAGGLHFWDRIELAVFHWNWLPDAEKSPFPIALENVLSAMATLAHELGHRWAFLMQFDDPNATFAGKELTRITIPELPKQASTRGEDIAECFRAGYGCKLTRWTFSDNKPFKPGPRLDLILRVGPPLKRHLDTKAFTDLAITQDGAELVFTWREWGYKMQWNWWPLGFYQVWQVLAERKMDRNGVLFTKQGATWVAS